MDRNKGTFFNKTRLRILCAVQKFFKLMRFMVHLREQSNLNECNKARKNGKEVTRSKRERERGGAVMRGVFLINDLMLQAALARSLCVPCMLVSHNKSSPSSITSQNKFIQWKSQENEGERKTTSKRQRWRDSAAGRWSKKSEGEREKHQNKNNNAEFHYATTWKIDSYEYICALSMYENKKSICAVGTPAHWPEFALHHVCWNNISYVYLFIWMKWGNSKHRLWIGLICIAQK